MINNNITQRQVFFLISALIILTFAPQLLTHITTSSHLYFYSLTSYLTAVQITLATFFLSLLGLIFSFSCQDKNFLISRFAYPFHFVIIGQLLLVSYVYLRACLNHYLFLVPISGVDFILIACALVFIVLKTPLQSHIFDYIQSNWQKWLLFFAFYFLLLVALSEHELPRLVMLSSDPDQHAFFGRQIQRFGTIPYHQFEWGNESFKYPAGTGILGFIWSTLSLLDIRDTLTIQTLLQAYIALFIITELTISSQKLSIKQSGFILLGLILIFQYCLPYSLDQAHYHLEGTGRLMSLGIFSLLFSLLISAMLNSISIINGLVGRLGLFIMLLLSAASLNPINLVNMGLILGITFLLLYKKHPTYYPYVLLLGFAFLFILMDPYYLQLFTGGSVASNIQSTAPEPIININLKQIESIYRQQLELKFFTEAGYFSRSYLLPQPSTYFWIVLITLIAILLTGTKQSYPLIIYALLFIVGLYLLWAVISSAFQMLATLPKYRLLLPYYRDNNFQLLYLFSFWLFSLLLCNISTLPKNKRLFSIGLLSVCLLLSGIHQMYWRGINKQPRVALCGPTGCATENDLIVIKKIENEYAHYLSRNNRSTPPKILIPNILHLQNHEKWLFPTGASRSLPFYNTFPIAFFYFQGSDAYTYDNYKAFICDTFNIDKLRSQHIQYLFIPEKNAGTCIFNLPTLIKTSELLAKSGNSYFLKLYP